MKSLHGSAVTIASSASVLALVGQVTAKAPPKPQPQPDPTGTALTVAKGSRIDPNSVFFQNLGANGRTCASCHLESAGWSMTPPQIQARFDATQGTDPLFRPNDGTNSPNADVSTPEARRSAYSMLLSRGTIRVGIGVPTGAEFELESVDDPYGYASSQELSLFRRPLPATNLRFQSTVMWDGRKTTPGQTLAQNLTDQASDATTGHAQAAHAPTATQLQAIVALESGLTSAQITDSAAGPLTAHGGKGGPTLLSKQKFYAGINDPFGTGTGAQAFNPGAFQLFSAFNRGHVASDPNGTAARASIERGEASFNGLRFIVSGVAGFNDRAGAPQVTATCTSCHNTPNVGNSSIGALQDIGISDVSRRTSDFPLYTLRNLTTQETRQTTDPGRALITGKWADIGKFKVPTLRGLAARAPYFHNGSAVTLMDVVSFYDQRFGIGYTQQDKLDLVAFLRSL